LLINFEFILLFKDFSFNFKFFINTIIKSFIISDWVNRASKKYETFSLINDLFEKFQIYKKQTNNSRNFENESNPNQVGVVDIIEKNENNNLNEKANLHVRNKSIYRISKDYQINEEETEADYTLKREICDLIGINLHQNYENKYIIDLSKYNNKVKKGNPEFVSFGLLDIDPKFNIKSYQCFNYSKLYNRYLAEVKKYYYLILGKRKRISKSKQ